MSNLLNENVAPAKKSMKGVSVGIIVITFIGMVIGLSLVGTVVTLATIPSLATTSPAGTIVLLIPLFYVLLLLFMCIAGLGIGVYM